MNEIIDRLNMEIPYNQFMGIEFFVSDDNELIGKMAFERHLIGNPLIPALHGGGIAGFMEASAIASLIWAKAQSAMEIAFSKPPKTINITPDYLRPGLSKDSYAQASIHRLGRRYASVHILAWQDDKNAPIAECVGHFLVADWSDS